jgi:hypothetical protein
MSNYARDHLKSNNVTVGKLFADGANDNHDTFRNLVNNRNLLCIKLGKNAGVRTKTVHIVRNLSIMSQRHDLQS